MYDNSLEEYLFENNINVVGNYFTTKELKDEKNLLKHVDTIVQLQNILMKYHSFSKKNIVSLIGKENSRLEILGRSLERKYSIVLGHSIEKSVINKFNVLVEELKDNKFKPLIKRAVLRDEVSILKIDQSNLRIMDEIEVGKIKKTGYDLIEEDFIKYLRKLKRFKEYRFLLKCIDRYIEKSTLDNISKEYILLKLRIPEESIKYLNRNEVDDVDLEELLKLMSNDEIKG